MKIQERTGVGAGRSAAPVQPSVGDRLPSPPRERKPALAALAVLLILLGALGATMLVLRVGDRVEVVKVTADIQAGESIGDNATFVMVAADDSINYVEWTKVEALKDLKAKSTIYKDTVVMGQMFAEGEALPAGKASVGLALKEGQYPTGIKSGDTVAAYRTGANNSGSSDSSDNDASSSASGGAIVTDARVTAVKGEGDSTVTTGNKAVTVLVDEGDAAALASAAAAGEVAVVRVPGK
ncbi:hypothetical protein ACIQ1J_29590 [Streptomyces sp. NPDC097107]|uniref:hypothetical protein n=1 Tax=Streptomyces sp. NPDC097107 TaxID=3366089 RepID=UPI003822EB65